MSFSKALDFFIAEYPYISSDFLVIADNGIAGFSKISGITCYSNELKPFAEGGLKNVHILAEQDKQFNTLVLEKGVGRTDILETLGPLKLFIIVSLSRRRLPKHAYSVSGAVLQKITVSDFNAGSSSVLISSATVAYRKIEAMSLMGLTDELMPSAAAVGTALIEGGVSGAVKEITGTTAKTLENGLLETIKSVNANVDKKAADKLLEEAEEKLNEFAFGSYDF